jgi:hypothetical protein
VSIAQAFADPAPAHANEIEFSGTEIPHALYRLYDANWVLLYVGISWNLPQRMGGHAADKDWWPLVAHRTMAWYPSELDARKAEAEAIDAEQPIYNDIRPAVSEDAPPHGQRAGWHREKPLSLRLPEDLRQRLEDFARATGQPVRKIIGDAVRAWLDRHAPETTTQTTTEE